jgi:hypothetical protein
MSAAEPHAFADPLRDPEAEQLFVGVLLRSPTEVLGQVNGLDTRHFSEPLHALAYGAAINIHQAGGLPTLKAVFDRLRGDDLSLGLSVEQIGEHLERLTLAYSATLAEDAGRAGHRVADLAIRRQLAESYETAALALRRDHNRSASDILAEIPSSLPGASSERLRLMRPSEFDWQAAQYNLIDGLIGHRMLMLHFGPSGAFKTATAIDMAMHIVLGWPWCGRDVAKGSVIYLAPEGAHSVSLRHRAWCKYHGIDPEDDTIPFRLVPARIDLCRTEDDARAIIANIKAAEAEIGAPKLVIGDTVSRALAGGDENSPADMGALVRNADLIREETGATVDLIHHSPLSDSERSRGHQALNNASEVRLCSSTITDTLFKITAPHLKDGPSGSISILFDARTIEVGKNDKGDPVCGIVAVQSEVKPAGERGRPKARQLTDRQLRALQALQEEARTAKRWEFSADEVVQLWIKGGAIDGDKPENAQRARASELRTQLANRGLIKVDGDLIRLVVGS